MAPPEIHLDCCAFDTPAETKLVVATPAVLNAMHAAPSKPVRIAAEELKLV